MNIKSRTHRVALDWIFDRIILDPRTKNQLAEPSSSLVEHHELPNVFLQPFSFEQKGTMSKRAHESRTKERPAVAKNQSPCVCGCKNLLSAKQTSSLDSGASNVPWNQEMGQTSVFGSTAKPAR